MTSQTESASGIHSITEKIPGSDSDVHLMYIETWDGLYAPIGLRVPSGDGPHPVILLGRGNGGGGMEWIREAVADKGYIMDRLLEAGYACAWIRYRTEVELGYHEGGKLIWDQRQGRDMFNRGPLEYEDEIAIIDAVKTLPYIDGERVGLVGVSHAGEMIFKLTSEYHGAAVGVACEPANHEYLALTPDDTAFVDPNTGLRNIEEMQMPETEKVRARIDLDVARSRIDGISTPILVMGREDDHLQGIFRTSYELLEEAGKEVEWVSWDHHMHGYIYPERGEDREYEVDEIQDASITGIIEYLDRYLK